MVRFCRLERGLKAEGGRMAREHATILVVRKLKGASGGMRGMLTSE